MVKRTHNRLILLVPLLVFCTEARSQGFSISSGTDMVMSGPLQMVLSSCNFNNDGAFTAGNSILKFTGSATNSNIGGTSITGLYDLTIDEATNDVVLANDINVENNINFISHNIELDGFDIDLGTTGTLMNESETSRITGVTGGKVLRQQNLTAPSAVNPGNIGIEITSGSTPGITQIVRGHVQQTGTSSGLGIYRYFDIIPAVNSGLNATLGFHYFDAELAGNTEANLGMSNKPISSGYWTFIGDDGLDVTTNLLTKNSIDSFHRFTLSSTSEQPLSAANGNIAKQNAIKIYPNPATDKVTIEFYSRTAEKTGIKLLDVAGRLIAEKQVPCTVGNNRTEWNIAALPSAIYYLQFEDELQGQIKIIKQ